MYCYLPEKKVHIFFLFCSLGIFLFFIGKYVIIYNNMGCWALPH